MMKEHDLDHFISGLRRPSRKYTPIPFWFLNGDLRHNQIKRQLRDFSDHGVYGVVLHPRMGLSRRIGYLSPLFFSYLRTAVETASELDMKIVLYDEGMFPSGSAKTIRNWLQGASPLPGPLCLMTGYSAAQRTAAWLNASAEVPSAVSITGRTTGKKALRGARTSSRQKRWTPLSV